MTKQQSEYLRFRELFLERTMSPIEKLFIIGVPVFLQKDDDGVYTSTSRDLGFMLSCSSATAEKALKSLDKKSYAKIVEKKEGRGGGYRFVLKYSLLVSLLLASVGVCPALHKPSPGDTAADRHTDIHYITRRKKSPKRRNSPGSNLVQADSDHEWFATMKKAARHPLGQLQPGI